MYMKQCIMCGKWFKPKTNAQRICEDKHYRACEVCGKLFEITRPSSSKRCCSKECTVKKRESTQIERTGYAHALQNPKSLKKAQRTTKERYGVEYAAQSDEIKQKVKEHFQITLGVDCPFQMTDFWDKAKQTNLQKYGTEYAIQSEAVQKKSQDTCKSKYGTYHAIQSDEIKANSQKVCLEKYGVPYPCMTDQCRESSANVISKLNNEVAGKLNFFGLKCELDKIKLDRYSYDIHIIDTNILIEIDPTYTHNSIGNHWNPDGIDNNYHLRKTQLAIDHGYRCIHIFDWDNIDLIVNMLSRKRIIYARNCEVREIDSSTANSFESAYHLQSGCRGQSVCMGLYYQNELVQVMTFGKPRYNSKYEWELLRLCTKVGYSVVGGANRLFKHFLSDYVPRSIISYCDISKFGGEVYSRLGMNLEYVTPPQKVWSKNHHKVTDSLLRQRGYDQLFGTNYGKGTSNEQLMIEDGWLPVYDCGQYVYSYIADQSYI